MMRGVRLIVLVALVLALGGFTHLVWAGGALEISCGGTESTGGGSYRYHYMLRLAAGGPFTITDFTVGTNDPNPANYTWYSPSGMTPIIVPNGSPYFVHYMNGTKTPHGNPGQCTNQVPAAAIIVWSGPHYAAGGTVSFGFDHPSSSWDTEWSAMCDSGWTTSECGSPIAGPFYTYTDGYIHAPSAPSSRNLNAKVAVHVLPHTTRACTKSFPAITSCAEIITTEPSPDVDAFPVFFDLVAYQGFDYGMTWPGLYSCVFTSCSDLTIGGILWPGDGVSHAWYAGIVDSVAIPGWAWIWDYGMVCVVPHPGTGSINIGSCQGEIDHPICNFCAGIGGYFGDDPCEPTKTEPTSWGGIKALFR